MAGRDSYVQHNAGGVEAGAGACPAAAQGYHTLRFVCLCLCLLSDRQEMSSVCGVLSSCLEWSNLAVNSCKVLDLLISLWAILKFFASV